MYTLNNTKSAYAGSKKWTAYEPKSVNSKVIAVGSNMKFFRYKEIDFWLGIAASINAPYNVQKSLSKIWSKKSNFKKCINVDNKC